MSMAGTIRRVSFALASVWSVVCSLPGWGQSNAPPHLIGNTSCATSTCHGGVIGRGPAWNSSASQFLARDPHTRAGEVLNAPLSRQIVQLLEPDAAFEEVLKRRCVSCHATVEPALVSTPNDLDFDAVLQGVSCEACHGPASQWVQSHVSNQWQGESRFTSETGMRNTEDWMQRTLTCIRCHIGSRSEDGLVRDMNHDMIAAGHPALRFDMTSHFSRLPKHWEETKPVPTVDPSAPSPGLIERHHAARVLSLWGAAKLSSERMEASRSDPTVVWPELADHDCFACHHTISIDPDQRTNRRLGRPEWNPWYLSRLVSRSQDYTLGNPKQKDFIRRFHKMDYRSPLVS